MMVEHQQREPKTTKRKKKRIWLAIVVVLTLIVVCFLWSLRNPKSVEERLAEIEAARAIPDSENAALIYNELLAIGSPKLPESLEQLEWITRRDPWSSKEHPQLAEWIESHEQTITRLLEAAKLEECRFPIPADVYAINTRPLATIRQWAFLLSRAGCNDIGEGRTDAGIEKHLATVQLGRHICQQPLILDHIVGSAVTELGLRGLSCIIIETPLTQAQLKAIEQFPVDIEDNWAEVSKQIFRVEDMIAKKSYGMTYRLLEWVSGMSISSSMKRVHDIHLRIIAGRQALKIIIGLSRHKDKQSSWPKTLDEVKALAPAEAFVDPLNGGAFVYKLTDESFTLYSKGANKIDEDGRRNSVYDPKTNEYVPKEDDVLFWPPREPKMKKENDDPNHPDTSTEPTE